MIDKIEKFGAEKFGIALKEIGALSVILFLALLSFIYQYFSDQHLSKDKKEALVNVLDSFSNSYKNFNSFSELDKNLKKKEIKEKQDKFKNLKIDIKTASNLELMKLPNIGEKTAEEIINYRNKFGFEKNEDLLNVKGIGEKTYQKLEKYLSKNDSSVNFSSSLIKNNEYELKLNKNDKKNTNRENSKNIKVDLNTASAKELMRLSGIGEVTAKKIIEYRSKKKFEKIEDLMKIKGISNKKFENVKNFIEI